LGEELGGGFQDPSPFAFLQEGPFLIQGWEKNLLPLVRHLTLSLLLGKEICRFMVGKKEAYINGIEFCSFLIHCQAVFGGRLWPFK
jgi:hypothetical protein